MHDLMHFEPARYPALGHVFVKLLVLAERAHIRAHAHKLLYVGP